MAKQISIKMNDWEEKQVEEIKDWLTRDSKLPKNYTTSEVIKMCVNFVHTEYELLTK